MPESIAQHTCEMSAVRSPIVKNRSISFEEVKCAIDHRVELRARSPTTVSGDLKSTDILDLDL